MTPLLPRSTWTVDIAPLPLTVHPKNLQALIRRLRTPAQVQCWLHTLQYNTAETMYTLDSVVRRGRAHCLEGAMAAAALLEPHSPAQHRSGATSAGYPPLILDLESADLLDHTLFIFQRQGKWGAVGKSRDIGLDGRKPVFRSIEALARSYLVPYVDAKTAIIAYAVLDLRTLKSTRWRTSNRNVWYVEEALRRFPHRRFRLPRERERYWQQRYIAFKRCHPNRQPNYFPERQTWW